MDKERDTTEYEEQKKVGMVSLYVDRRRKRTSLCTIDIATKRTSGNPKYSKREFEEKR